MQLMGKCGGREAQLKPLARYRHSYAYTCIYAYIQASERNEYFILLRVRVRVFFKFSSRVRVRVLLNFFSRVRERVLKTERVRVRVRVHINFFYEYEYFIFTTICKSKKNYDSIIDDKLAIENKVKINNKINNMY